MRTKILLSCVVFLIVALLLQMLLFQNYSGGIIYTQAQRVSERALVNLQDDLYTLYKAAENSLIQIYADTELMLDFATQTDGQELEKKYRSIAYDMAYSAFDASQNLAALYLYTREHVLVSLYRHAQTPMYTYPADLFSGDMAANGEIVKDYVASEEHAMLISGYYNTQRKAYLIRHVLKMFSPDGRVVGYLVCDLGPKAYDALLGKYRYSQGDLLWLQRPGDQPVLLSGENQSILARFEKIDEALRRKEEPALPSGYELFHAPQRKYQMNAYLAMPQSALMENQAALNQVTILVCGSIVVLFSLLFMLVSRGLTNPLTYMVKTMNRIKGGQKELRMERLRSDEFGQLGMTFNGMLDQIDVQTQREVQSQLLINDAKYKALQAQINPHFLYNTLDTVSGIATVQHADMVAVLCRALSNMFRYSLHMSDTFATIEDELAHLKNYMLIIGVRLQGAIALDVEIPHQLMRLSLPRLTLQPLVENAVQHGLRNKRGDKRIWVRAETDGDTLLVTVADNGVGMDVAKTNEWLQSDDMDALTKDGSIGLSNIHARLRLLWGMDSGLSVGDAVGGGSVVTLRMRLPKEVDAHAG
jgi:sensor histidine kinase YesM